MADYYVHLNHPYTEMDFLYVEDDDEAEALKRQGYVSLAHLRLQKTNVFLLRLCLYSTLSYLENARMLDDAHEDARRSQVERARRMIYATRASLSDTDWLIVALKSALSDEDRERVAKYLMSHPDDSPLDPSRQPPFPTRHDERRTE